MKKKLLMPIIIALLVLGGCSASFGSDNNANQKNQENQDNQAAEPNDSDSGNQNNDESKDEKEDLTLQVVKSDKEQGIEIDDNPLYGKIQGMIDENPKLGSDNTFSVITVDIFDSEGDPVLLLMAINRTGTPIKNVAFELSVAEKGGDQIFYSGLEFPEDQVGVINSNSTIPFTVNLTDEIAEQLQTLDEETLNLEVNDIDFDEAE